VNRPYAEAAFSHDTAIPLRRWQLCLPRSKLLATLLAINVVALIYFGVIASPIYVSNASVIVRNGESAGSNMTSLLSGATGNGAEFGGYVFKDFAKSWEEFDRLNRSLDLADHYRQGDIFGRFGGPLSLFRTNEIELWRYYQRSIGTKVDTKSGIVSLEVEGYDPAFANKLATALLRDAVANLTAMNGQRERQLMSSSNRRVDELSTELAQREAALANHRQRTGIFEPSEIYQARLNLLNSLAVRQTELAGKQGAALRETPNSPMLSDVNAAMSATKARIAEEEQRIAETSRRAAAYDSLRVMRDNTVSMLNQASTAMYEAQRDAINNGYFLNVISQPSMPPAPELPYRLRWILGIAMVSLLVWAILR
jgi:capsular polysaccharide transport system permease protein